MKRATTSEFDPPRRTARFIPAKSLTVAVLDQGLPIAYGVVANICEGGLCVQTSKLEPKRDVEIVLSFTDGAMLTGTGRIAWNKPLDRIGQQWLYGMEFVDLPDADRNLLVEALETKSAVEPYAKVQSGA